MQVPYLDRKKNKQNSKIARGDKLTVKQKYVTCLKLGELTVLLLKLFILVNVVAS